MWYTHLVFCGYQYAVLLSYRNKADQATGVYSAQVQPFLTVSKALTRPKTQSLVIVQR